MIKIEECPSFHATFQNSLFPTGDNRTDTFEVIFLETSVLESFVCLVHEHNCCMFNSYSVIIVLVQLFFSKVVLNYIISSDVFQSRML